MFDFLKPDHRKRVIIFEYEDDEGWERRHAFPAKPTVCDRCDGRGVHDHPAFSGGICSSDFETAADQRDFMEQYRRGDYDVPCSECGGRNVVLEIDRDRADPAMLALLDSWIESTIETERTHAAERRMGA